MVLAGFDYDIPPILQEIFSFKMGCTNSVWHLLKVFIFYGLRRLYLLKHLSLNKQIDHNGLFKCSKYTI